VHAVRQTRTLAAAVVGAIAASQTHGSAGALTINGSLASGGVATMLTQQQIGITSTANYSAVNFTITGTDGYGRTISEVLAGANNGTANSVFSYLTVTSIVASAAAAVFLPWPHANSQNKDQSIVIDNPTLCISVCGNA